MTTHPNPDDRIQSMLATVAAQKAEVAAAEVLTKRNWETHCSYQAGASAPVNIQTAPLAVVHQVMTDLVQKRNAGKEAADLLGIKMEDPLYSGFTFEQWAADLKKRVAYLTWEDKRRKLVAAEARLNQLLSPERRRDLELAELEQLLEG